MFPFFSTLSLILWTYFLRNNSMTLTNLSMFENHTILIYIKIHHIFDNLSPYLKTSNQTFLYIQIYKQNQLHLWLKKVKFPTKLLKAYSFSGNFIQLKFYIFTFQLNWISKKPYSWMFARKFSTWHLGHVITIASITKLSMTGRQKKIIDIIV